jgi:MerR family transcriptional regulator/heat shock protein HspR
MSDQYYQRTQVLEIFEFDESFLDELESEELIICSQIDPSGCKLYDPHQFERLRIISNLTRELDVNLPGVEVILQMRENMISMRRQFDQILALLVQELKTRFP